MSGRLSVGASLALGWLLCAPSASAAETVTWAREVSRLFQSHCETCHRPAGAAPFGLTDYASVKKRSRTVRDVVAAERMPPWHADPRYGSFANDRRLSSEQKATILAWLDAGAPLGDRASLPPPREYVGGWRIGEPDVIFELPEVVTVPAAGEVPYHDYRVSTGFDRDVWVQAAEARPGNRRVVHHIIVAYFDENLARIWAEGGEGRTEGGLGGYVPGDGPLVMPPGLGRRIPAGATIAFQMHYTPTGRVEEDRSMVGLVFAEEPPVYESKTGLVSNPFIWIPAGAEDVAIEASYTFAQESVLLSMRPHMHLRGRSFEYKAVYPDGREEILLRVPRYDFNWQTTYVLAEPKPMPEGTELHCTARYDNSTANPFNPDPEKNVSWGERTTDEMMIGFFQYHTMERVE